MCRPDASHAGDLVPRATAILSNGGRRRPARASISALARHCSSSVRPALFDVVDSRTPSARRRRGADVVDDRRGRTRRSRPARRIREAVRAAGTDGDRIERGQRALRRGVVPPDRFDDVADELEPDRLGLGRGIEDRRRRRARRTRRARRRDLPGRNPASARRSPSSCGAISKPGCSDSAFAARPAGSLSRGSSARADAMTRRRGAGRQAVKRPARAEATSRCGVNPRYGSTSCDGNGST